MREIRPSGSEGGVALTASSLPLSRRFMGEGKLYVKIGNCFSVSP